MKYLYINKIEKVESGEIEGVKFDYNGSKRRRGVKVFR
jgi:hypothetical protein